MGWCRSVIRDAENNAIGLVAIAKQRSYTSVHADDSLRLLGLKDLRDPRLSTTPISSLRDVYLRELRVVDLQPNSVDSIFHFRQFFFPFIFGDDGD